MRRTNIILLVPILLSLSLTISSAAFSAEKNHDSKQGQVGIKMEKVTNKMDQVEVRLHHMEKQLDKMDAPINSLNELKKVVNVTSTLILFAIVGVGLFVAVGIPIGVVIAWRYRNKILNKVDQLTPGHDHDPDVVDSGNSHPHTPVGPVKSSR